MTITAESILGYRNEIESELKDNILPFWINHAVDHDHGGFYGHITNNLTINKEADKGCILNSRILWSYAAAYRIYKDEKYLETASRAYEYMLDYFWDKEFGGLYWMLDYKGNPVDMRKHAYNIAFGIYALSEYYSATGNEEGLKKAIELYYIIEKYFLDHKNGGYFEALSRDWTLQENLVLCPDTINAVKTMNTQLHMIEAFTNLYRVWKCNELEKSLHEILRHTIDKVIDKEVYNFILFFNAAWNPVSDIVSYGHDIEGSWLIYEAAEVLGDIEVLNKARKIAVKMVERVYNHGVDRVNGGVFNESEGNHLSDPDKPWWPQAEAMVGFLNAYELTGKEIFYLTSHSVWEFIKKYVIDKKYGEWFWKVTKEGEAFTKMPKVEPWKCPYHNSRACLEIVKRINQIIKLHGGQSMGADLFNKRLGNLIEAHNALIQRKNVKVECENGIYDRYQYPVLTNDHTPLFWRYDLDAGSNPYLMERIGVNCVFNPGAIEFDGKIYLIARVEGNDRKSFFAVAESENGLDNFKFWDFPIVMPETKDPDINVYDMRVTKHEDGWIYGLFCTERKDPDALEGDTSSAVAACGIARTKDLRSWERLADLKTASPQQRNVVLHPEFINGKYALYTRPQDGFIDAGQGGGIGWGYTDSMENASIEEELIIDKKVYHTIKEVKNGQGPAPIKTDKGWLHIAHGVRNTAAGLRYVIYSFMSDLKNPGKVTHSPGGFLIAPVGEERIGDVSNVVFCNGVVAKENGDVFIYYASSDTRVHVAATTVDKLVDYVLNTPEDPLRSYACVSQRIELIAKNLELIKNGKVQGL